MRLIDADVLLNEIKEDTETVIEQDDKVGSFWLGYIAGLVIKQPTIQSERAEGEWILYDKRFPWRTWYKCSKCGNYLDFSGVNGGRVEPHYCPNCGAKMKGKLMNKNTIENCCKNCQYCGNYDGWNEFICKYYNGMIRGEQYDCEGFEPEEEED